MIVKQRRTICPDCIEPCVPHGDLTAVSEQYVKPGYGYNVKLNVTAEQYCILEPPRLHGEREYNAGSERQDNCLMVCFFRQIQKMRWWSPG